MHIGYYSLAWPPAGAANDILPHVSTISAYLRASGHNMSVMAWEQRGQRNSADVIVSHKLRFDDGILARHVAQA